MSPANFGPMGGHTVELPPNVLLDCPKARCKTAGRMGEHPSTEGKLVFSWLPIGEPRHRFIYMYIYIYIYIDLLNVYTYIYIYIHLSVQVNHMSVHRGSSFSPLGVKKKWWVSPKPSKTCHAYIMQIYIYIYLVI